jgi:hypothetical protein
MLGVQEQVRWRERVQQQPRKEAVLRLEEAKEKKRVVSQVTKRGCELSRETR